MSNPLMNNESLPKFDQIEAKDVKPAMSAILKEVDSDFSELETTLSPSWEGLLEPLFAMDMKIHYIWSPVGHLNSVKNSDELRKVFEEVQQDVITLSLKMSQSKKIYEGLIAIQNSEHWQNLRPGQRRIIESRILSAKHSGIALEGEQKEKFNQLTQELSKLSTEFSNNVLDATKAYSMELKQKDEIEGLPLSYLALASQSYQIKTTKDSTAENGPWLITLDYPSFGPFMENSSRSDLREKIYKAFIERASSEPYDNREKIRRILQIRQEKAKMLGYSNFAELSVSRKMAPSVDDIMNLEEDLRLKSWDFAQNEMDEIRHLAKVSGVDGELQNWDIAYWAKRLQEKKFQYTDDELRPYFPFPKVLHGLFSLVEKIFNIKIEEVSGIPAWDPDVMFFDIKDMHGQKIASFYLDPYSRPENKRGGAWMNECIPRYKLGGKSHLPVAYLVLNSTPPVGKDPSLLTFREVETLFHEFGHGLQHMLTTVDDLEVSGINGVEWDAVELPSQFMENWCYHKETLMGMAKHYKTGETLPEELFYKLYESKTFRAGQMMLRQIQFGLIDMLLHSEFDPYGSKTVFEVQNEVAKKTSVLPPLENDFFLCSFTHIFAGGYAAGYYSYKWAEVLSADAFSAFEDVGLDNLEKIKEVGMKFRDTILSLGGSEHPMKVFEMFRGRKPSTDALLRHSGLIV